MKLRNLKSKFKFKNKKWNERTWSKTPHISKTELYA